MLISCEMIITLTVFSGSRAAVKLLYFFYMGPTSIEHLAYRITRWYTEICPEPFTPTCRLMETAHLI